MKRLLILLILCCFTVFQGCEKEDEVFSNFEFKTSVLKNNFIAEDLKNMILDEDLNWDIINYSMDLPDISLEDFDFENAFKFHLIQENVSMYCVNLKSLRQFRNYNVVLNFVIGENGLVAPILGIANVDQETTNFISLKSGIKFYISNQDGLTKVKSSIQKISDNFKILNRGDDCKGENVMACMEDVYSNRGWQSVFTSVATAFVPQVAVGVALSCTAHNCAQNWFQKYDQN